MEDLKSQLNKSKFFLPSNIHFELSLSLSMEELGADALLALACGASSP